MDGAWDSLAMIMSLPARESVLDRCICEEATLFRFGVFAILLRDLEKKNEKRLLTYSQSVLDNFFVRGAVQLSGCH